MTPSPGLVLADQAASFADHSLAASLSPGDPILASLLIAPPADRPDVAASLSMPLTPSKATSLPGTASMSMCRAWVSPNSWHRMSWSSPPRPGSGGLGGSDVSLLVAVDQELAMALVEAVHTAEIDLVRRPR